jgi:hypothetical protein
MCWLVCLGPVLAPILASSPAAAESGWICSIVTAGAAAVTKYQISGNELIDQRDAEFNRNWGIKDADRRFTILRNTPEALIAVTTDASKANTGLFVYGRMLLIEKGTGRMTDVTATVGRNSSVMEGTCASF